MYGKTELENFTGLSQMPQKVAQLISLFYSAVLKLLKASTIDLSPNKLFLSHNRNAALSNLLSTSSITFLNLSKILLKLSLVKNFFLSANRPSFRRVIFLPS